MSCLLFVFVVAAVLFSNFLVLFVFFVFVVGDVARLFFCFFVCCFSFYCCLCFLFCFCFVLLLLSLLFVCDCFRCVCSVVVVFMFLFYCVVVLFQFLQPVGHNTHYIPVLPHSTFLMVIPVKHGLSQFTQF